MNVLNTILGIPLGYLMYACYTLIHNYGMAIIVFTVLTKVILLPVSIWVHKNGIKVVRLQPEINNIKTQFFGDGDQIAEETATLYKREKYNPFASIIPLLIQIVLLIGLVNVIYHPLNNILHINQTTIDSLITTAGDVAGADIASSSVQLAVVDAVKDPAYAEEFMNIPGVNEHLLSSVRSLDMQSFGISLAQTPSVVGGVLLWIPILAGAASLLLCLVQNKLNPLQAEQNAWEQLGTTAFSVGLSLFLGAFVPAGVGFYWIWSNLFTIVQQFVLNKIIDPKKQIDYEALEKSKMRLAELHNLGEKRKLFSKNPNAKREKTDYKKFFSIVNKHLVFYSEKSGFFKYYETVIEYLLSHSNVIIHYVTSDPNDAVFELSQRQPRIRPYYVGDKKLITLFMKMDADIVVMTVPDIDNFHLKRSYLRKDSEYIYMFHYPLSTHMVLRKGALDHYDTIFCVGDFQLEEIRQTERLYDLPPKNLVVCGYGQLESLYERYCDAERNVKIHPKVLIAPSWQQDNILDSCIDALLGAVLGKGFNVSVRPHPEYVKRFKSKMDAIVERYSNYTGNDLTFELDFSSNNSIFDSDVVITDWSGTAYEFSFVTKKPSVFTNTTPKINNPDFEKITVLPLELKLRDQIGIQLDPGGLDDIGTKLEELIASQDQYAQRITEILNRYIANFGHSGEVGGRYIIRKLKERGEKKNES